MLSASPGPSVSRFCQSARLVTEVPKITGSRLTFVTPASVAAEFRVTGGTTAAGLVATGLAGLESAAVRFASTGLVGPVLVAARFAAARGLSLLSAVGSVDGRTDFLTPGVG